jgi:RNA polymerase-binding transcription factor DksA
MPIDETTARRLLDDERRRLEEALALTRHDLAEERLGRADELAAYDQHPAEQGTEVSDAERDLGLQSDFEARLQENDGARRRVEQGSYGICDACGEAIPAERLEALPSTRFCTAHAARAGAPS